MIIPYGDPPWQNWAEETLSCKMDLTISRLLFSDDNLEQSFDSEEKENDLGVWILYTSDGTVDNEREIPNSNIQE